MSCTVFVTYRIYMYIYFILFQIFLFQTHNNGELRTRYENFLKVTLQCFYTTWFVFVAVSRVLDRRHHVTDVIAGSIWGIVFAVLIVSITRYLFYIYLGHSATDNSQV